MCWWFFQCFQKSIESRLREHMHLIYDVHLILPYLRRKTHLVYQMPNIIHRVIRRGI